MQQPSLLLKSSRRVRQAIEQVLDATIPEQFPSMFISPIPLTLNIVLKLMSSTVRVHLLHIHWHLL